MKARRPTFIVWLVVGVVVVLFTVCLADALAWIGRPFSGLLVSENGIVVSIGRGDWAHMRFRRVPFSRVLAVDGHPVADGSAVRERVEAAGVGAPIELKLRKGTDVFRLGLTVTRFGAGDFVELFLPFLGVGLAMALVGAGVVLRRPAAPEAHALFAFSTSLGVTLITSPDAYAPYRFTAVFLMALCAIPPAFLQLALTYPRRWSAVWRRPALLSVLYVPFLALALALRWSMPEPSLFLPLLYTVYLLAANAALFYVGGLVFGLIEGVRPREPVLLALAAIVASGLIGLTIGVTYPLLKRPVSPSWFVVPFLVFPVVKAVALLCFLPPTLPGPEELR